jgi:hypothetical protein
VSINNGAWEHRVNRAQVAFSDEEVFLLSHIDETWNEPRRYPGTSILEHEMACQRDMRVRGKRLWSYHERLGDLADIIGEYNTWPLNVAELLVQ